MTDSNDWDDNERDQAFADGFVKGRDREQTNEHELSGDFTRWYLEQLDDDFADIETSDELARRRLLNQIAENHQSVLAQKIDDPSVSIQEPRPSTASRRLLSIAASVMVVGIGLFTVLQTQRSPDPVDVVRSSSVVEAVYAGIMPDLDYVKRSVVEVGGDFTTRSDNVLENIVDVKSPDYEVIREQLGENAFSLVSVSTLVSSRSDFDRLDALADVLEDKSSGAFKKIIKKQREAFIPVQGSTKKLTYVFKIEN